MVVYWIASFYNITKVCVKVGGENGILFNNLMYLDIGLVGFYFRFGFCKFEVLLNVLYVCRLICMIVV